MANPLRSEAAAYRFLLLTIGYFALIVAATLIFGTWVGFTVFVILSAVALWRLFQGRRELARPVSAGLEHAEDDRRILVVANETVGGATLVEEIHRRAEGVDEHVLVVTPALNSPLKHWVSDEDGARASAAERLQESLVRLRAMGVNAEGEVGDADPLQAIEDALRTFGADEIIISTHPEGRSHWLERGVVEAARARFSPPITHVVVDLATEREEVRS
jgi:hypothetical protein